MNVDKWFKEASREEAILQGSKSHRGDPDWFLIGCADYPDRVALMLLVEAARALCGMRRDKVAKLMREALSLITRSAR